MMSVCNVDVCSFTYKELVVGREEEFPTLALAARDTRPAPSTTIYWETPRGTRHNHCQIVRVPVRNPTKESSAEALIEFLSAVEETLVNGVRSESPSRMKTCGGYKQFLMRSLEDGDKIVLRSLRDPAWREWDDQYGHPYGEWIGEFSLEVVPA